MSNILRRTRPARLASILRRSVPVACILPFFQVTSPAQTTQATLGEKVGGQLQSSEVSTTTSPRSWDAFRLAPPPMSPFLRSGDFSLETVVTTGIGYDDNLTQRDDVRLRDFRWEFAPQFRARYEPSSWSVGSRAELNYTPQAVLYADHGDLNTVNHEGSIGLSLAEGKSTLDLKHWFSLSSLPELMQYGSDRRHQERTTLEGSRELGGRTRLGAQLRAEYSDIQNGLRYWEFGERTRLDYLVRERLALGLGYGISYVDLSQGVQFLVHEPMVGVQWVASEQTRLWMGAGVEFLSPMNSSDGKSQTGALLEASATHAISEKTSLQANLSHKQRPSYYAAGQLDTVSQGTVSVSYKMTERVTATTGGTFGYVEQSSYSSSLSSAGSYSFWQSSSSLQYGLSPRMSLLLAYRYSGRNSNFATPSFERNFIGLNFAYRL